MPKLKVIASGVAREVQYSPGSSLREILAQAGFPVRSGCLGNGACGLCRVQVEAAAAGALTKCESIYLSSDEIASGVRLACQLMPDHDLSVRLIRSVPAAHWRDLSPRSLPCTPAQLALVEPAPAAPDSYGLAVDLGTTHISLSLWDLNSRRRLAARIGPNTQSCYGVDVITRLTAAAESPENSRQLARLPLLAIAEGLHDICARDGVEPGRVRAVSIVGNAAMLTLLTETDARQLLQPRMWTQPISCHLRDPDTVIRALDIDPEARVEVIAPLAGFVGSDLAAGLLATRLMEQPGTLLIDFGTNSELALWDGRTLHVTSAAGGPAFEGSEMQCGMPAEAGAIYRLETSTRGTAMRRDKARNPEASGQGAERAVGKAVLHVIGGGTARGLCGSGLVDLIALLRSTGKLTPTGKLRVDGGTEYVVQEDPRICLTNRDVDAFQRAKAAIGTGIQALLSAAGMQVSQLSRVCACGVFGQHLNIRHAQALGLLPDIAAERLELCGNTALAGCEYLLVACAQTGVRLSRLRERVAVINLSQVADFDRLFLENLYLEPLKSREG